MPITTDFNVFAERYHNKPLISGMDEIIAHIKKQEQQIKKLNEENEQLKHNNYCLRQDAKGYSPSEVQEYREEIEELKEQNKNLELKIQAINQVQETQITKMCQYGARQNNDSILLAKALVEQFHLHIVCDYEGMDWNSRFCNFYNTIMSNCNEVEWTDLLSDFDIYYESYESIRDSFMDDEEYRMGFCENEDIEENSEKWNDIVKNCNFGDYECDFIQFYLNDIGAKCDWCDYDGGYWYIEG